MLASKILSKYPEGRKGSCSRHRLRGYIHLLPKAAKGLYGISTKKILKDLLHSGLNIFSGVFWKKI